MGHIGAQVKRVEKRKCPEHEHQKALFQWAELHAKKYPELNRMFAIPNGGFRFVSTARKLKAEGVKAGVPDLCLPVPRGAYHSLWIEMKVYANKPTKSQEEWLLFLNEQGHLAVVAYGWEEARDIIEEYVKPKQRKTRRGRTLG